MYLLDTDVLCELRRTNNTQSNQNVLDWAKSITAESMYISVISVLELDISIISKERENVMDGAALRIWLQTQVLDAFSGRILPVDVAVAQCTAGLCKSSDTDSDRNAIIAATAVTHRMAIATQNSTYFRHAGVDVINPWTHC